MNNQLSTSSSQPSTTFPSSPEPPGPVPAPAPRQAGTIPVPPLSSAVGGKTTKYTAAPNIVFVRAEKDMRGRWTGYYHAPTGGRIPITEDGFLIQSGCCCLPGDAFLTVAELKQMLALAKSSSRRPQRASTGS